MNYPVSFYLKHSEGSSKSADVILRLIFDQYRATSIIDVGCGSGDWLLQARKLGVGNLTGVDGHWVEQQIFDKSEIDFVEADLGNANPKIDNRYDLCMSMEVAEHLPEARSYDFVSFLCSLSDVVVFSAAVEQQGGTAHIHERWQSYWISLFADNGYDCCDIVRPSIWNNNDVEWWYRQNTFVFVRRERLRSDLADLNVNLSVMSDVVHPAAFLKKIRLYEQELERLRSSARIDSLRKLFKQFIGYLKIKYRS